MCRAYSCNSDVLFLILFDMLDGQAALIIGILGLIFFIGTTILGVYCLYHAVNKYTKRIFFFITLANFCELPRYITFISLASYTNRLTFCIHLLGNYFYFAALSCLCFAWGDVLRAKNLEEFFESKRRQRIRFIIIIANIIFALNTLAVMYRCASSDSLSDFFELKIFESYSITDTIKNLIMGLFITRFGYNLYIKVSNYSAFYARSTDQHAMAEMTKHLLTAAEKLKYLVLILNICFIIRGIALLLWLTSDAPTDNELPKYFPPCASVYWVFFEILPAVIPLIALAFTMGSPAKIWGGVFIDTNKSQQEKKRYTSESAGSDMSNSDNISPTAAQARSAAAIKALAHPLISQHSQYDDEENPIFNRLSRISGELVDLDINEIRHSATASSSWKDYSNASSNQLSS